MEKQKERIIKLSVPSWNRITPAALDHKSYGICYQQCIDQHNYGPYGFSTAKAAKFIENVFPDLLHWNHEKERLNEVNSPWANGIYFYGRAADVSLLLTEVVAFRRLQTKNSMLQRNGQPRHEEPPLPVLISLYDGRRFNIKSLEHLISKNYNFFIRNFYTPQAGEVLFFYDAAIDPISQAALQEDIDFVIVNGIDELKPW